MIDMKRSYLRDRHWKDIQDITNLYDLHFTIISFS